MPSVTRRVSMIAEFGAFLAKRPEREEIVRWKPSARLSRRIRELLTKQDEGRLTAFDQKELDDALQDELTLRAIKATFMSGKAKRA